MSLHRDHVVPTWKGGPDTPDNWQYLCANCHEDKTFEERRSAEYREFVGRQVRERMLSPEAKRKISDGVRAANKNRVWTNEMRQQCSLNARGKKRTPEQRARISAGLKGKPKTAKHRAALSAAKRRNWPILFDELGQKVK